MTIPDNMNWHAWINAMPGANNRLYVTGEIKTGSTNQHPKLAEAAPQGINPAILILDLSIVSEGTGIQLVGYRPARFERDAKAGQFTQVEVRFEGNQIAMIEVEIAH